MGAGIGRLANGWEGSRKRGQAMRPFREGDKEKRREGKMRFIPLFVCVQMVIMPTEASI